MLFSKRKSAPIRLLSPKKALRWWLVSQRVLCFIGVFALMCVVFSCGFWVWIPRLFCSKMPREIGLFGFSRCHEVRVRCIVFPRRVFAPKKF